MWWEEKQGPTWMPVLNDAEQQFSIPHNLLARVAYQESSFRPEVISGQVPSPVGALGIMQLMPQFFPDAGKDPHADILAAGAFLASLHRRFQDWQVALAAYNWGGGDVHHEYTRDADQYILADMPQQTQNYVRQIVADVPVSGVLVST